jgi:hypothetical protein
MSGHTTVHSRHAAQCPDCKQPKFSFVLHVDGSRCEECHIAITTSTRPRHVAAAEWKAISLEISVFNQPKVALTKGGRTRR